LLVDKAGYYCVATLNVDNQESKVSDTVQK